MAGRRVHFVMDAELLARIDAALPLGVSRGEFVRRAVEQALSEAKEPSRFEQADPGSVPSSEGVRSAAPAEQSGDVEQALVTDRRGSEDARVSFPAAPAPAERPRSELHAKAERYVAETYGLKPPHRHLPGPNVENIRSSAQSKRDVRPIPKRGER